LAITKQRKNEVISEYVTWLNESKALVVAEYTGMTMKDMDALRAKVREAGGEFHIIKNTLGRIAFEQAGYAAPGAQFEGSTAVAFAFSDVPAVAKIMSDQAKSLAALNIKGGYLDKKLIGAEQVKALADLPPLPVVRAQILGTILAPASKLVRTLAEPGRMLAAVMQAKVDQAQPA